MTPRSVLFVTPLLAAPLALTAPVPPAVAARPPAAVTRPTRLEARPDIARAFGTDVAGLRRRAAAALTRAAAGQVRYRSGDLALYAVPARAGRLDERSRSYSVMAVPRGAVLTADGTVAAPARGLPAGATPAFSSTWGTEQLFHWAYLTADDGGAFCTTTRAEIRGQWEYAKLANVDPSSPYDYWGIAARAVAEVTEASNCDDTIDWFHLWTQVRAPGASPARQDPVAEVNGRCSTRTFSVGGSFSGVNASISQQAQTCERWRTVGALSGDAAVWYGVSYDNNGRWDAEQREAATLMVVRVPRGIPLGLNTTLDLDVDNR